MVPPLLPALPPRRRASPRAVAELRAARRGVTRRTRSPVTNCISPHGVFAAANTQRRGVSGSLRCGGSACCRPPAGPARLI